MNEIDFEISFKMPFGKNQCYIVGHDTMGDGVVFYDSTVCCNQEELGSEIYRVISENDLHEFEDISLEEQVIIAELKTTPPLNYREFELKKVYR
jgi:hypothetical protein